MQGCLLLNKSPGISSFKSLNPIKKALGTGKVCHTGTLDSFAQGLLVILTGRAVKLSSWFTGLDKQYRAVVCFGKETDTLDPLGKVINSAPVPLKEDLEAALPAFTGAIMQAPPSYSAIHINGKRAHELARAGIEPEMKKRPVTVYSIKLCSWDMPYAELEIHCSSGTYIRSLARDIALSLNSRSHLSFLQRTRVGKFALDNAIGSLSVEETIRTAIQALSPELFAQLEIPSIFTDEKTAIAVSHGKDLKLLYKTIFFDNTIQYDTYRTLALFGPDSFAALIEQKNESWTYGYVNAAD